MKTRKYIYNISTCTHVNMHLCVLFAYMYNPYSYLYIRHIRTHTNMWPIDIHAYVYRYMYHLSIYLHVYMSIHIWHGLYTYLYIWT